MIAEVDPKGKAAELYTELAVAVAGRPGSRKAKRSILDPLIASFSRAKA